MANISLVVLVWQLAVTGKASIILAVWGLGFREHQVQLNECISRSVHHADVIGATFKITILVSTTVATVAVPRILEGLVPALPRITQKHIYKGSG